MTSKWIRFFIAVLCIIVGLLSLDPSNSALAKDYSDLELQPLVQGCIDAHRFWLDPAPRPLSYTLNSQETGIPKATHKVWIQGPGRARWEMDGGRVDSRHCGRGKSFRTAIFTPQWDYYLIEYGEKLYERCIPTSHFRYLSKGITWESGLSRLAVRSLESFEFFLVEILESPEGDIAVIEVPWEFYLPVFVDITLSNLWLRSLLQHSQWIRLGIRINDFKPIFEIGLDGSGNENYRIDYSPDFFQIGSHSVPRQLVYTEFSYKDYRIYPSSVVTASFQKYHGHWLLEEASRKENGKITGKIYIDAIGTDDSDPDLFDCTGLFSEPYITPKRLVSLKPDEEVVLTLTSHPCMGRGFKTIYTFEGPSPYSVKRMTESDEGQWIERAELQYEDVALLDTILDYRRNPEPLSWCTSKEQYEMSWSKNGDVTSSEDFWDDSLYKEWSCYTRGMTFTGLISRALSPEEFPPEEKSYLHGYVRNDLGEPLAGIEVHLCTEEMDFLRERTRYSRTPIASSLKIGPSTSYVKITKDDGSFFFRKIGEKKVRIEVRGDKKITGYQRYPDPEKYFDVGRRDLEVRTTRCAFIRGSVWDSKGCPLDNTNIEIRPLKSGVGEMKEGFERRGLSFPTSKFEVEVEPGVWILKARKKGYGTTRSDILVVSPGEELEGISVTLLKNPLLSGVVIDAETGKPLNKARIYALHKPGDRITWSQPDTETGSDGTFSLERFGGDPVFLTVRLKDYAIHRHEKLTFDEAQSINGLIIKLDRGGEINGNVSAGMHGTPVELVRLRGFDINKGSSFESSDGVVTRSIHRGPLETWNREKTKSTQDGDYRFENVSAGMYETRTVPAQFTGGRVAMQVNHDGNRTLRCDLAPGNACIEGVVSISGSPKRGVSIHLDPLDPIPAGMDEVYTPHCWARTDGDGCYGLYGLYPGRYTLKAKYNDEDSTNILEEREITLAMGKVNEDFHILPESPGVVTGVYLENGEPVENAMIYLERDSTYTALMRTDEHGQFSFTGVSPGTMQVYADYHHLSQQTRLYLSKPLFYLKPNATVKKDISCYSGNGIICGSITENQKPVEHAFIDVEGTLETANLHLFCTIEANDGVFAVEKLISGNYELKVRGTSTPSQTIRVSDDKPIRVDFDVSD